MSMSPMPPMPPRRRHPWACRPSGSSATIASVVSISAADRRRVLQRGARDLGRIERRPFDHVAVFAGRGVVAEVALALGDLVDDHRRLLAGVLTICAVALQCARSTILMPASWSALAPFRPPLAA